jgi:tyrosine-protein kinase Etk/Wzc
LRRSSGRIDRRPLLAHSHPGDLAVEALRSLRTSLHFAMLGADNRVVMITGASPGVGKTFVTANLGVVLAQAGKRVVVIDGDLRKGYLHSYFGIAAQPGLSNYLAGDQAAVPKLVRRTAVPGLDVVPRGEAPPNPSELLLQPRLKTLLAKLGENYDYVLIDSPPVLAVTDAAIIGNAAGTTLLVARFGVNTVREMDLCRRRLARNGVMVRGGIFNALERRAANTYGYYAYYQYRYGEGERRRSPQPGGNAGQAAPEPPAADTKAS